LPGKQVDPEESHDNRLGIRVLQSSVRRWFGGVTENCRSELRGQKYSKIGTGKDARGATVCVVMKILSSERVFENQLVNFFCDETQVSNNSTEGTNHSLFRDQQGALLAVEFFSLCNSIPVYPFKSFPFLDSKLKSDNLSKLPLEEHFIEF
jgi:hypothetical protein